MGTRIGTAAALFSVMALFLFPGAVTSAPGISQEAPKPQEDERRCVCDGRDEADRPSQERCVCWIWPDSLTRERIDEAMARMEQALERARVEIDPERLRVVMNRVQEGLEAAHEQMDPERLRGAMGRMEEGLERAREELARMRLDTLTVFRTHGAPVRIGLQFSPDPVEGRDDAVRLTGVTPESAASEAGLREGDLIVEVNGHDLSRPLDDERIRAGAGSPASQRLQALTAGLEEGDTVRVVYIRDGERHTAALEARRLDPWGATILRAAGPWGWEGRELRFEGAGDTILVWPPRAMREAPSFPWGPMQGTGRFGLRLMDLNPELGSYFGREEGVLVLEVRDGAPVALEAGDVILRIDGREVRDTAHAQSILQSYRAGEPLRIDVHRRGRTQTLEGQVP